MNRFEVEKSSRPEDPIELSKRRILKMAQNSPHDFKDFKIEELEPEDFILEQKFQDGVLGPEELHIRMLDYNFFGEKSLNLSQKELGAYLINKSMKKAA